MKKNKYIVLSFVFSIIIIFLLFNKKILNTEISLVILLLISIIHFIVYYHHYYLDIELKKLNKTIESILNGKLDVRMVSYGYENSRELSANINRLAKKIAKITFKSEEDEQTIKILTNNITSPIIYVDIDGKIRYVNNQFLNQIEINIEINDIYEKIRTKKLYEFIDDAFTLETKDDAAIQIRGRFYQANAIPINNQNKFVGILFIFQDITELKKYEKLQKEFLADASHELKTPVSAIKGASEILLNGVNHSKETVKDFLTIIKNENERMERIVRDILLISRLENENILINIKKVNIKFLLEEAIEINHFKLDAKNQELHVDLKNNLYIEGDYERLKHVFLNLISNAINYTDKFKTIYIKSFHQKNNVIISIRDEGIGIGPNEISHIFKRFYRVDKNRSRDTGGTGLGLAIVKSTLDIHKATIKVNSELNTGTEFIIKFKEYIEE